MAVVLGLVAASYGSADFLLWLLLILLFGCQDAAAGFSEQTLPFMTLNDTDEPQM